MEKKLTKYKVQKYGTKGEKNLSQSKAELTALMYFHNFNDNPPIM